MLNQQSGRQDVLSAEVVITAASVSGVTTGGPVAAVELPKGAIVVGGDVVVEEVFNSTTDTLAIGDDGSTARYGSGIALQSLGRTALTLTGYKYLALNTVDALYTHTGGPATTGRARIRVEYVVAGRVAFSQGIDQGEGFAVPIDNNP